MKFFATIILLMFSLNAHSFEKDPWEQEIAPDGGIDDGWPMNGWETLTWEQWKNQGYPDWNDQVSAYTCDSADFSCTCRSKRDCRNLDRDNLCIGGTQVCVEKHLGNPIFPTKIWMCTCDWKDRPKG